jgi:protoporphyrinogen oxidase
MTEVTVSPEDGPVVVVGAGMAGLGLGTTLQREGFDVTVLERLDRVGGLARSIAFDDHIFDVGPHYFFLDVSEDVNELVQSCLRPEEWRPIDFKISALIGRRDVPWPPSASAAFKLPLSGILQYLKTVSNRTFPESHVAADFLQGMYGTTMYRIFLDPYLRKKIPISDGAERLHRDWYNQTTRTIHNLPDAKQDKILQIEPEVVEKYLARYPEVRQAAAAAPGAVKDTTPKVVHMFRIVRGLAKNALSRNYKKVLYPPKGVGVIMERVAEEFIAQGGKLILRASNVDLEANGRKIERVTWNGGAIDKPSQVVWTGSLHRLCSMLDIEREELPFMTILLGMMKIKKPLKKGEALYTYVADPDIPFNRVYYPNRSVEGLCPAGKDSLCVEISPTDFKDEADPARLTDKIYAGLEQLGVVKRDDIEDMMYVFVPDSYPVYPLDYREKLERIWTELDRYENVRSIGRSGQFWYNNMARSMKAGIEVAQDFMGTWKP